METKQWTFVDKSDWGHGNWINEPDKVQWTDPLTGLPCLVVRNHMGGWCGYVGVSAGHPYFEKDYNDCEDIDVHGGLTYGDHCQHDEHGICHVVNLDEDDNVWWLGFDCLHAGDLAPGLEMTHRLFGLPPNPFVRHDHYWTLAEVRAEVADLARQLASVV